MIGTEKIFVYGTLRPPQTGSPAEDSRYYPQIEAYVRSAEAGTVADAELYNMGAYPAARPGQGTLHGDLLTLKSDALAIADRIEGHPQHFYREKVTVETKSGVEQAWIYWAPRGLVAGMRRISCGDWFRRNDDDCQSSDQSDEEGESGDEQLKALVARFAQAECSWFSSVRPSGRAHSVPVWHVWHRGRIYVVTQPGAVKVGNIGVNPGVVVAHPDPINPVIIEGWAAVGPDDVRPELQPLFQEKYSWDISTDEAYSTLIEIVPTKLMAWGQHGEGRWDGAALLRVRSVPA